MAMGMDEYNEAEYAASIVAAQEAASFKIREEKSVERLRMKQPTPLGDNVGPNPRSLI